MVFLPGTLPGIVHSSTQENTFPKQQTPSTQVETHVAQTEPSFDLFPRHDVEDLSGYFLKETETIGDLQPCVDYKYRTHLILPCVQQLFSTYSIQDIFSGEVKGVRVLERGEDMGVIGYEELPSLILKIPIVSSFGYRKLGGLFGSCQMFQVEKDALILRPSVARLIQSVIETHQLTFFEVPRKRLVATSRGVTVVIAQEMDLLNEGETSQLIQSMEKSMQKRCLEEFCLLIEKAGLQDIHMRNIRMNREKKFALVDTEPKGNIMYCKEHSPHSRIMEIRLGLIGLTQLKKAFPFDCGILEDVITSHQKKLFKELGVLSSFSSSKSFE